MSEGGDLRSQLETALKRIKDQDQTISEFTIATVASKPDFHLVTADDLQGVPNSELDAKAKEIQQVRVEQQKSLLKSAGLDDEAVEKVIAGEALNVSDQELDPGLQKLAGLQSGGGATRPPTVDKGAKFGREAIKAHFREEAEAAAK